MDAFIGEIRAFANNFNPEGWLPCLGQRVSIGENQALFSIVQTLYGPSDMRTYFTLPDLRGKTLVGIGGQLGLGLGETKGEYEVTLNVRNLPEHSHSFTGARSVNDSSYTAIPEAEGTSYLSNFGAISDQKGKIKMYGYVDNVTNPVILNTSTISQNGGNLPHNNISPCLIINYYICNDGYYPQRP